MKGVKIFDFGIPGPTTLVVGLVHGNEIVGKKAITYLHNKLKTIGGIPGKIITLYGNLEGGKTNQRYIDTDLNRAFDLDNSNQNYEAKRATEIKNFFKDIYIDYLFDLHSTPSDSEPMILCTTQKESIQLASKMPIKYVIQGIIDIVEGTSLLKYFQGNFKLGMAFECGSHNNKATIRTGKNIIDIILDFHQSKKISSNKNQIKIKVTDLILTSDENFSYTKPYKGFECLAEGEIWGKDTTGSYQFPLSKILVMPNTVINQEVKKAGKTRVAYFGDQIL